MIVLGLESSCDETAACLLEGPRKILSHQISSQMALHHAYGGVVPEIASRRHIEVVDVLVRECCDQAGLRLSNVDLLAVTVGPGLIGSLLIGVTFAKTLAYALQKPIVGIHHLEAHLYAPFLENLDLDFPFVSLIVSGGHTLLVWVKKFGEYEILGSTHDDAAGEAYDKVAKLLGLGYPGGPVIDELAGKGNPKAYRLPRPLLSNCRSLDFSFSGLKTAVLYAVKGYGSHKMNPVAWEDSQICDLAASFQEAVVDCLVEKSLRALHKTGVKRLAIGGGVAANSLLRRRLQDQADQDGFALSLPSKMMCTDNAVMVAGLGFAKWNAGRRGEPLEARATLKFQSSE